jgi:hypothetical protein
MVAVRLLGLILCSVWLACGSAQAERRVALVVGNAAYRSVPQLTNPVNDAALVGDMFRKAGFNSVDVKLDVTVADMRKALRDFGAKARDAEVAVIYYAGHGIELDGTNYLVPVDAALETDTDVLDEAFPLDRVLFAIEPAKQLRLVILDACRDNPFAKTMKRAVAARSIGRGLAKVEPTSPNTMIAFAAKAGSTASDGDGKNSPFAVALTEHLPKPGLDLRRAFGFVRDDVLKNTGNKQEPYVYGSLGGNDVPLVPAIPVVAGPQADPQSAVRRDYELALQLNTRTTWESFLVKYPSGFYADLARGQLDRIAEAQTLDPGNNKKVAIPGSTLPADNGAASPSSQSGGSLTVESPTTKKEPSSNEGRLPAPIAAELVARSSDKTSRTPKTAERKKTASGDQEILDRPSQPASSAAPTGSRTCSQTRDNCLSDRKRLGLDASKCAPYYAQCMKTGIWHSGFNHFENVARR